MTSINLKYIRGEITSKQYIEAALNDNGFAEIAEGCEGLAENIKDTLAHAFWRLDSVDRADPFWVPGNGLPTLTKIGEYSKIQIQNGRETSYWSWVDICLNYYHFAYFLYPDLWRTLETLNLNWLVRTSWNYQYFSGSESTSGLSDVLVSLGVTAEALPPLNNVANINEEASIWVKNVVAQIEKP